jgi:hypothetical protein
MRGTRRGIRTYDIVVEARVGTVEKRDTHRVGERREVYDVYIGDKLVGSCRYRRQVDQIVSKHLAEA